MKAIIAAALSLFSQERQIYYKNKRFNLAQDVEIAKSHKFPFYSKAKVIKAERMLEDFDESFALEFKSKLMQMIDKGIS